MWQSILCQVTLSGVVWSRDLQWTLALIPLLLLVMSWWICIFIWLASHIMTKAAASAMGLILHIPAGFAGLTWIVHSIQRKKIYTRTFLTEVLKVGLIGLAWVTCYSEQNTATRRWLNLGHGSWSWERSQIFKDPTDYQWKLGAEGKAEGERMLETQQYIQGYCVLLLSFYIDNRTVA